MIEVLYTYGNNPASWLIRELTGEPGSHVSIRWEGWVLHSNFLGVQWVPYDKFIIKAHVIDKAPLEVTLDKLLAYSAEHVDGSLYDYGGMAYLGLRLLCRRFFGIKLPKKNLWSCTGMFMCTEWVTGFIDAKEDAMITPMQLMQKIKDDWNRKTLQG